jgi:putative SOS response-associated peptidase YedK
MCGRFTQSYTWRELVELYRLTQPARNLRPRYNIAPTTAIDVVSPIQLSRVLNVLQEPNVVFGQAVRSSAPPQQCEVPERWVAVVFIALGNVGHGLQRRAADVLGIQP